MSDYLTQIKKIDRLLNDPSITPGERRAAENRRNHIQQQARQDQYNQRSRNAAAYAERNHPGRSPANSASTRGVPNTPRTTNPISDLPIGASPFLRANPVNSLFALANFPSNLQSGYQDSLSEGAYIPGLSEVGATADALSNSLGQFIPAYGLADFANGLLVNGLEAAGVLSPNAGTLGQEDNNGVGLSNSDSAQDNPYNDSRLQPVSGGQESGVQYRVRYSVFFDGVLSGDPGRIATGPGPISKIGGTNPGGGTYESILFNGEPHPQSLGTAGSGTKQTEVRILDIERADGQPDNSGDHPGYVPSTQPISVPNLDPSTVPPPAPTFDPPPYKEPETPRAIPDLPLAPENPDEGNAPDDVPTASPFPDLPSSLPIPLIPGRADGLKPKGSNEAQPGNDPKQATPPESCNPRCATPGINATKQMGKNILDALGNIGDLSQLGQLGLLATILDAVNGISGAVGVADFPITVPDTINGKQSTTKKLNNLTEMHEWNARNLDSVMGHWPNVMNSDDGKVLEFDSLNDQMNELMGINMAIALAVGINQQLGTKSLVEMQGLKQESHLAHRFARMNSEYLGYRVSEKVNNSPSAISINANDITGFLNPSTVPFVTARNEENQDLQTCLTELCEAAHIVMARFKRRVNAVDPERDLRDLIKQAQTVRDDSLTVGQRKAVSDFDEFIQQVEQGFGIADSYGRDNNQNPSIIDFSS